MAKLSRVFQKIFGSTANASDIGVIGSLHEGTPTEATTIESIQSLPAFESGLRSIVIGENSPILEEDNAFYKLVTYQLAYLLQQGIPEWNSETSYFTNQYCLRDGVLYRSLIDNNLNTDLGDPLIWESCYLSISMMPRRHIPVNKIQRMVDSVSLSTGSFDVKTSEKIISQGEISFVVQHSMATIFKICPYATGFPFKIRYSKSTNNGEFVVYVKNQSGGVVGKAVLPCPQQGVTYEISSIDVAFWYDQETQVGTTENYSLYAFIESPGGSTTYTFEVLGGGAFIAQRMPT